jgi:hypothetical protein
VAKDKEAMKITFKFAPNPFFKNKTLEREDGIDVLYTYVCVCVCVCVYICISYIFICIFCECECV